MAAGQTRWTASPFSASLDHIRPTASTCFGAIFRCSHYRQKLPSAPSSVLESQTQTNVEQVGLLLILFSLPLFATSLFGKLDMRRDVQEIFRATPRTKQVMMFSATLSKEIRPTCKKFMTNVRRLLSPKSQTLNIHVGATAAGDLRRRRDQAHLARSATTLCQARRSREEPQAQRPARQPRV